MNEYNPRYGFTGEEVRNLCAKYYALRKKEGQVEFSSADDFVKFAVGKYRYGYVLERIDDSGPWSADNCIFVSVEKTKEAQYAMKETVEAWDRFTAPLREKYASQIREITQRKRQFWRYEHPDLVREGIVFGGS